MNRDDRILGGFRSLAREAISPDATQTWIDPATGQPRETAPWAYLVPWRYRVEEATETTCSARALSPRCPQPDMPNLQLLPGVAGTGIKPAIGATCVVVFCDGDPAQPFVVGWDQTVPQSLTIDASGVIHVAPTATGTVQIGDDAAPNAQAVALAPAVQSFADATSTFTTATSTFSAALGVVIATIPTTTPMQLATFAAALSAYQATIAVYASAIAAVGGSFPTGFASLKTTTK